MTLLLVRVRPEHSSQLSGPRLLSGRTSMGRPRPERIVLETDEMHGPRTEENKDLIRRWIEFANARFPGSFDPFTAANYTGHLGATTMDRQELERLERQFCAAFPDAHHTVDDLIAEGDRIVLRTTARATHEAEFVGIPATGRSVEFTGLVVYRIAEGKIAESWGEIDFLRLIRTLHEPRELREEGAG